LWKYAKRVGIEDKKIRGALAGIHTALGEPLECKELLSHPSEFKIQGMLPVENVSVVGSRGKHRSHHV
jgi:hypothetical protein